MSYFGCSQGSLKERFDLRTLLVPLPSIQAQMPVLEAAAFLNRSGHDFAAVELDGRVIGICSRLKYAEALGTRYGYALHSRSKVEDWLESSFLEVRVDDGIVSIFKRVFEREESCFWQDVVVQDSEGNYLGLLKAHALAKLQSRMLEDEVLRLEDRQMELEQATRRLGNANLELEEARDEGLQAARAKSDFLAMMSHEIRTPLNGVLGMMALLLESQLDVDQEDLLRAANDSAEALLHILNDILDFSRLEAGKFEIESHRFNLREMAESVLVLMADSAQESGLEVICDIDLNVPYTIMGDSCRLRQILANLLGNAVKFTEKGQIALRMRCEKTSGSGCQLRVEVEDTGIGVSEEAQTRLFQPFAQADSSTTRRYGGTGLGLAICSQIVKAMGGEIGIVSEVGKGTTFWLTLDCHDCTCLEQRYDPPRQASPKVALLCMESDEVTRILERELGCRNFVVLKSSCVELSREMLATAGRSIDLLLADSHFWKMGIGELARDLPTVLLYSSHGRALEKDASQARAHLCKPLRPSQIDRCLESAMRTSRELKERRVPPKEFVSRKFAELNFSGDDGSRVLVVEDNAVNRRLVTHLVTKFGFHCSQAEDGIEALELCGREQFDVILLDCRMPRMDGYDFARSFREAEAARGEGTRMPIIALTANAMQGDRELCFAAGMDSYLTKPIKKQSLWDALQAALDPSCVLEGRDAEFGLKGNRALKP